MAISGGTYVIVQHAAYLHDKGYDVTLAVQEPFTADTLGWHDCIARLRCVPIDAAKGETFDLVIATWWKTALELHHFNATRHAYFVQSIESRFYPEAEVPLRALVDATYRLPCAYVTEATWIQNHLATRYGHAATLVRNGIRKDLYRASGPVVERRNPKRQPRVLVEGPFGVAFKNTALAVRLAREARAKDIWVLTSTPVKWVPGVSRVFSRVPMNETPQIYRSCDILLKLSTVEGMFGPPLEIFHCGGTAVVLNVTGHDEYIVDGRNARVVRRDRIEEAVSALRGLLGDRDELAGLQAGALTTAQGWASWTEASQAFGDWLETALDGPCVESDVLAELNENAFARYVRDERQRLAELVRVPRHRLGALAARFPSAVVRSLRQLEAAREVWFAPREFR